MIPPGQLQDRTLLITGASSGIGAHFARTAATAGAKVVLAARRLDRLTEIAHEIEAAGGRACAVTMDVTDEASTIAAFDAAEAAFGPVDSLVANAGMNIEGAAIDVGVDAFDALMAINLRGVFLSVREAGRRMRAADSRTREHGRIVIVSSITARYVEAGLAAYSASKAGVLQLGRVLAREWAREGISVNSVLPGYILTELNAEWFATGAGERQISRFPRRRIMDESALDPMLLYLCSDQARHVTGGAFTIDDGQSL